MFPACYGRDSPGKFTGAVLGVDRACSLAKISELLHTVCHDEAMVFDRSGQEDGGDCTNHRLDAERGDHESERAEPSVEDQVVFEGAGGVLAQLIEHLPKKGPRVSNLILGKLYLGFRGFDVQPREVASQIVRVEKDIHADRVIDPNTGPPDDNPVSDKIDSTWR